MLNLLLPILDTQALFSLFEDKVLICKFIAVYLEWQKKYVIQPDRSTQDLQQQLPENMDISQKVIDDEHNGEGGTQDLEVAEMEDEDVMRLSIIPQ